VIRQLFFPEDLPHKKAELARLAVNIGVGTKHPRMHEKVAFVGVSARYRDRLFLGRKDLTFHFFDPERTLVPRCLEEVVLTQVPERGAYWQNHDEATTRELWHLLQSELERTQKAGDSGEARSG